MISPAIPANDEARIASLRRMNLLSSPREADLDRIVRLAHKFLGTEIALISLIDRDRQWFKARVGLDVPETERRVSFCGHAINGNGALVVEDAARDERFHDNPLVAGAPNIRFYAGQPITNTEGFKIGTLCAISREPRTGHAHDLQTLEDLGRMVEIVLTARELGESQQALLQELEDSQRDSLVDPLTGLWNRRGYDRLMAAELAHAARQNQGIALAVVDIDYFKRINDRFGHAKGDEALALAADLLKRVTRSHDIVARYGGEEFVIVARDVERTISPVVIGDKITQAFRAAGRLPTSQGEHAFTVSAGIAVAAARGETQRLGQALFEAADKALYQAKANGRNRYEIADGLDSAYLNVALA